MYEIRVDCPRELEDGERCGADIVCLAEYVPGEWYGADADGNRAKWIPEHLEVVEVPGVCPEGHDLTPSEYAKVCERADWKAWDEGVGDDWRDEE